MEKDIRQLIEDLNKLTENKSFSKDYQPGFIHSQKEDNKMIESLQGSKIENIKHAVDEIDSLILQRENLTKEIFRDIEKIKIDINNFISSLADPTNTKEQLTLRQKQVEIEEMKLQEKVNSWRDVALLKKELRERIKEMEDKESRTNILDSIIEG